jgi:hypothetical protein
MVAFWLVYYCGVGAGWLSLSRHICWLFFSGRLPAQNKVAWEDERAYFTITRMVDEEQAVA